MKPYYQDKYATIYHGDCLELLPEMPKVDLVLTDPPFKISQKYTQNVDADNLLAVSSIWPAARNWFDILKEGSYLALARARSDQMPRSWIF